MAVMAVAEGALVAFAPAGANSKLSFAELSCLITTGRRDRGGTECGVVSSQRVYESRQDPSVGWLRQRFDTSDITLGPPQLLSRTLSAITMCV